MTELEMMKNILDSIPYRIVFVDMDHIIRYMNKEARHHYYDVRGYRDLIGKSIFECHSEKSKAYLIEAVEKLKNHGNEIYLGVSVYNERKYINPVRDENGEMVDGDQIMGIVGVHMRDQGKLKKDTIVATVMSNLGFFKMGEREHLNMEQTKVGDRYVLERMREIGASLGGEQSGHIIFLDENTTGDGLLSALHLLQVMVDTKKPLSELAKVMTVMPQALINAKVPNHKKDRYMEYPEIAKAIEELDRKFAGEGRVLIRPSGTEPKVRVMIEGKDQEMIENEARKLADLIQNIML